MKRRMKTGIGLVATGFLITVLMGPVGAAEEKSPPGLLDGKTFTGETGEKGKNKGNKEDFVFKDGHFDPLACHKYGFSATPYQGKKEGEAISFEAEHSNKKGDRMKWAGTIKKDALEGKMVYWQGKKAPVEYWFRGKITP